MKNNKNAKEILNYVMLIVGSLMVGMSVGAILLPVKISTGGFSRNSDNIILFISYSC